MNTRRTFTLSALMASVALAGGCGTTLPRTYDLGDRAGSAVVAPGSENGLPLVVIRFPARVAPQAAERYASLYENRGFFNVFYTPNADEVLVPWVGLNKDKRPRDMQGASTEAISKTTYLAVEFYTYLSSRFPPGTVRLMPTEIDVKGAPRKDGVARFHDGWPDPLVEQAAAESPPAVIYVDLFAYVNPFHRTEETTFGASLMPIFSARSSSAAARRTGGALVLPDAVVPYLRDVDLADTSTNPMGGPFVEYLNGAQGVPSDHFTLATDARTDRLPAFPGKALILPVAAFGMDPATLSKPDGSAERPLFDAYCQVLTAALNSIDRAQALRAEETRYAAIYDPALAERLASGAPPTRADVAAFALIRQFERAEWKLIGLQDDDFARQLARGAWGASYRKTREAEERFKHDLDQAYSNAENAMMMQAFAQGMPTLGARPSPVASLQASMDRLQLVMDLDQKGKATNQELAGQTSGFQSRLGAVSAESVRFVFDLAGESTDIQARSVAELRAKMRTLYLRSRGRS